METKRTKILILTSILVSIIMITITSGYAMTKEQYKKDTYCTGNWSESNPCCNICDGNWTTYAKVDVSKTGIYYVSYKKPVYATQNSKWEIKMGYALGSHVNLTVPEPCWTQKKLVFKIVAVQPNPYNEQVRTYCYDGKGWQYLYGYDSNMNCLFPYEETMRYSKAK